MDAEAKRRRSHSLAARPPTPRAVALPCGPSEVLDLTCSPPPFPPPPRFTFPLPPEPAVPVELAQQACPINVREVLEDMLRSLRAPSDSPAERQSVIHFSPPFPNS